MNTFFTFNPLVENLSAKTALRADSIHWMFNDFRSSAIPDRLIEINAGWLEGDEAIQLLTEAKIAQIQKVNSYVTQPVRHLLESYACIAAGGWLAYGCDVEGQQPGAVPYFKPIQPRSELKNGKLKKIKYETPGGMRATPLLPWVDGASAAAIYEQYGVTPLDGETFWQAVKRCNLPLAITEGLKKALALIAHGIPAIALRGVSCWHAKGTRELHPEIKHFATPGRSLHIIFDQDEKLTTQINVGCEIRKLGSELEALGCKVFVPTWDHQLGKGIDDAMCRQGEQGQTWLNSSLTTAPTLKATRRNAAIAAALSLIQQHSNLTYPIERATEGEYLPPLPGLEPGAIHILDASMNAGKTTRIGADWVQEAIAQGWNVLVLAPLNSLGQQTAQNFGLPHIHDFGTRIEQQQALWSLVSTQHGLVMCPDSLHRLPDWFLERPLLLILDEANQVAQHLCEGNTLGRRWAAILEKFAAIATHAASTGAIALSEDGVSDHAVQFIQALSQCQNHRGFRHRKQSQPWDCSVYQGQASGFRARFLEAVGSGRRLLFVTSSQREAKRMERAIAQVLPSAKIVRIDSETNQQGQFRGFFESPDVWLETHQPDILILSPSAKSGVSIQGGVAVADAHFDSVWGYFPSLATDTHMQMLGRFRPAVPRFIFVPPLILMGGDQSLGKPRAIRQRLLVNAKAIAGVYGIEQVLDPNSEKAELMARIENATLDYLATAKAIAGAQKAIAHHALVDRLEAAGHLVQCFDLSKNAAITELWKSVQEQIWRKDAEAIATRNIDPKIHTLEWARQKLDALESSHEDRLTAYKILWRDEFPGVGFDDPEETYQALCRRHGAIRRGVLLQARAENLEAAKAGDREAAEAILQQGIRALHHLPRDHVKARVIAATGVLALLDGNPYSNKDERAIAIKQQALRYANEISYWLRLHIKPDQTPVEIAHKLLRKLAIERQRSDRPGEIRMIARPGRRTEKRDKIYQVDLSTDPIRARLLKAARRKLFEVASQIYNSSEIITLERRDTGQSCPSTAQSVSLLGAVVARDGFSGQWVIKAVANQRASIQRIDGRGFADNVPIEELVLLEWAVPGSY